MNKRTIALLICLVLAFGLTACGESAQENTAEETKQTETEEKEGQDEKEQTEFKIGETWTVEGLWSLTVDGVTEVDDRNEYSEKEPAAVYVVDYTYTNIGFEDETGYWDGLYISLEDSIVDSAGFMGYSYPGDVTNYPQETPVGATCKAQACIGVDNAGPFKLGYSVYDTDGTKYAATFIIDVE
jgi:hypothetical protein